MTTFRADVAYDGSGFHGFARQPGIRTIQGEIESALEQVLRLPVETFVAGRTDTGVHARRQVISFTADTDVDPGRIGRALTSMLGPEIAVTAVAVAVDDFHARFSAVWRSYRYQILNCPTPDPLRRHTTWHVADDLDVEAMNAAAGGFVGDHDFASFCRRREGAGTERTVMAAGCRREGDMIVFEVRARAFCHQMVRALAGFCVDVGRGKFEPTSVGEVLAAKDRSRAGQLAPAHGLILWDVGYDA